MREVHLEQNTPEWLEFRKTKIGASDTPSIMGVSPWTTPLQLWEKKLGFKESKTTWSMEQGHKNEQYARFTFEEDFGKSFPPKVFVSDEYPWMMASVDGISEDGDILEIKCPGYSEDHHLALEGIVPAHYMPQLQHQMIVCGVTSMWYYSFSTFNGRGKKIRVEIDLEMCEQIKLKTKRFHENMLNFEMPDFTNKDFLHIDDVNWESHARILADIKRQKKELEEQEEIIKKNIIELAGGRSTKGSMLNLMKCYRKGSIDYSSIPELENVDLEKYRKNSTEYFRFDIKE